MEKRMSIAVNAKLKKFAKLTGASQIEIDKVISNKSDTKVNALA